MDIDTTFQTAVEQYQAGNMEEAGRLCREILGQHPDDAEALHLLGVIYYQLGNQDSAEEYLRRALEYDPDNIFIYFNLANVFRAKLQLDKAIANYQKAIQINPDFEDAYYNLGIVLEDKGEHEEALSYYEKGLRINPNDPGVYNNIGTILQKIGDLDKAIACFQKALEIDPAYALAYHNLGNTHQKKKELNEAIMCYQKALEFNPENPETYYNLGTALAEDGRFDEALGNFLKASQLDPGNPDIYYNMGIAYVAIGELDQAVSAYQKALQIKPDDAKTLNNLGIAFMEKGRIEDAVSCYRKTIRIDSNDAEAHWNLSLALLLNGNFTEGWPEYEWRQKVKEFPQRDFPVPSWDGSAIGGRPILLHAEQGFGDTIQFVRYASLVAQGGARVFVECRKEMASLLGNVQGVRQVIPRGDPLPDFDFHCSLLSLPHVFGTTLENMPSTIPYITPDPRLVEKWRTRIQSDAAGLRIGLVWSGNPKDREDSARSLLLDALSPLAAIEGLSFYSLQKGEAAVQAKNPPKGMKLVDHADEINDFSDTAAIIHNLDMVISVDTAVAHLAGAVGRPVWTLLPFSPDWRWMLNREDSPWYPTMRLFRQTSPGDWSYAIDKISYELRKRITEHGK